jgi:predicted ribosome quality control (RQC) complex YloA/Tae2 family protein
MKNQIASIELKVLVKEFCQLENCRLDRVYDLEGASDGKQLVFQLNKSDDYASSKKFLVVNAPSAVYVSSSKPATCEQPGVFCSFLRKRLDNARLVSISQLHSERILEFVLSSKVGNLKLIIELFSKGNIILLDMSGIIQLAAESQNWKDRTIRPGFAYSPPPASADYSSIDLAGFKGLVLSSGKDSLVKCLAIDLGLSGAYAEEVCAQASVDKNLKPSALSDSLLQQLFSSLNTLLLKKPSPVAILDEKGLILEAFPFAVFAASKASTKEFSTFNELVLELSKQLRGRVISPMEASLSRKIREMEFALEQQNSTIKGMEISAKENSRIAEFIYENYQEIHQILDDYNKLRKSFTKDQLTEYFGCHKIFRNIDLKTGIIEFEIEETKKENAA